jgi:hypothetical protein
MLAKSRTLKLPATGRLNCSGLLGDTPAMLTPEPSLMYVRSERVLPMCMYVVTDMLERLLGTIPMRV